MSWSRACACCSSRPEQTRASAPPTPGAARIPAASPRACSRQRQLTTWCRSPRSRWPARCT
eukprot:3344711-Prymnesium_polylepis.1